MAILTTFEKQPNDVQDYNVDFTTWLAGFSPVDTAPGPTGLTVTPDAGITVVTSTLSSGIAKVWLSGGTTNTTYKITLKLVTVGGRTKEVEFKVKVKDT